MKTSDKLQAARALIEDPNKWSPNGWGPCRGQLCAVQALDAAFPSLGGICVYDAYVALKDVANDDFEVDMVVHVNDKFGHAAVMRMYDIAISRAMSDEAGQ